MCCCISAQLCLWCGCRHIQRVSLLGCHYLQGWVSKHCNDGLATVCGRWSGAITLKSWVWQATCECESVCVYCFCRCSYSKCGHQDVCNCECLLIRILWVYFSASQPVEGGQAQSMSEIETSHQMLLDSAENRMRSREEISTMCLFSGSNLVGFVSTYRGRFLTGTMSTAWAALIGH